MVNESDPPICQQQGNENNIINTEFLLWFGITIVFFVISVLLDCALIYYEDKVKWIKKKLALLKALINDYDRLVKEESQLKSLAPNLWPSEDLSGIHLSLNDYDVESAKEVVTEAEACIKNYDKHNQGSIHGCNMAIYRLKPIIEVVRQIKEVKSSIQGHLGQLDEVAKDIYNSMENSRSRNRSLLAQYANQENEETVNSETVAPPPEKRRKPSTSIDALMKKIDDLFSGMEESQTIRLLLPLQAFTKDLSQLQLESETEKLWRKEAEDLIAESEDLISKFSWWVSRFSRMNILMKNIPVVMTPFRKDMRRVVSAFEDLLDTKNKWGFEFIDRSATKLILPTQHPDNKVFTSAIESIRSTLDQSSKQVAKMNSMYQALEEMSKELLKTEETAGRKACSEQLKSIAEKLEKETKKPELNRLEQINKAIDLLQKIIKNCKIKRQKSTPVVGSKNAARELVSKLITSSDNPLIVSIVGMQGVGKSTMAEAIYNNKAVVNHFPIRVWVTAGGGRRAQVRLMKKDGSEDQTLPIKGVSDHLKGKLSLIVIDNVSKKDDFDKLRRELISETEEMANGSRIVLTTRFKNVALHADTSSTPHQIRLLTKEESWALFEKVTTTVKPEENSKEEKLAKKVVGRCGGLPLAIISVGFLMSVKGSMNETNLRWVLERINDGHNKTPWRQAWKNTRHELSETQSSCLYYMTLFPVDFEIPVRRLVNLWVAEGLVHDDQETSETSKHSAERILEELRDRSMIQVVELKSSGKIKTCRLPIMLREIILEDSNRTSHSQYSGTHLERRFAYRFDDRGLDANSANVFSKKGIPLSVFFFDKREGSKPGEHIGRIISTGIASEQFMEIRVLDLERVFRPQLPNTLGKLLNLKYLGLRWTYLEEFPAFISKLLNLETLDIKHTCIRVLPSSIWKLKKLRNLYLNQDCRSRLEGKPSGNLQENLYRLWGVFLYASCPLLRELHRLKNLRKLKLCFELTETDQWILANMIVQLNQLHSLRLRSTDERGGPDQLLLTNMSKLEKLSSLQLYGKLGQLCILPQNLIDLTLSASNLVEDPMPELENLLKLESLCIYADSFTGERMVCKPGSFPKLLVLRFWKLGKLKEWSVDEGAMPSLKEFEARSCEQMEVVPTGLKHLKNLRLIKLDKMPKTFMREILNSKKTSLPVVKIEIQLTTTIVHLGL